MFGLVVGKLLNIDHHRQFQYVERTWPDSCLTRLHKINYHQRHNFRFDNETYSKIGHLPGIRIGKNAGLETIYEDISRVSRKELECRYRLLERDHKTLSIKCNNDRRTRLSTRASMCRHLIEKNEKLTNKLETLDHVLRMQQSLNRRLEIELDECRDRNELLHFRLFELENDLMVEKADRMITYEKATMVDEDDAGFFGSSEDDEDCSSKYCCRM